MINIYYIAGDIQNYFQKQLEEFRVKWSYNSIASIANIKFEQKQNYSRSQQSWKESHKKKNFNLESQQICTTALSNSASSWHRSLYSHQKFISFHKIHLELTCLLYIYTNVFQIYIHVPHHLSERQHSHKVQKFDLLGIFSYRFFKIRSGLYNSFNSSVQIC